MIGVARTAEQRFARVRDRVSLIACRRALDFERNGRHRALLRSAIVLSGLGSGPGQLVFPHDALVAVDLALDPILKDAGFFGQQADDLELAPRRTELAPVGREADGLSNGKLGRLHVQVLLITRSAACCCRPDQPAAHIPGRPRSNVPLSRPSWPRSPISAPGQHAAGSNRRAEAVWSAGVP